MKSLFFVAVFFAFWLVGCSDLDVTHPNEMAVNWNANSSIESSSSSSSSSAISSSGTSSSSSSDISSSSAYLAPAYGFIIDNRNGVTQKYLTIQIGSQRWMAENLNYGAMVDLGTKQSAAQKFCDFNNETNCSEGKGGLYQWHVAMGLPESCYDTDCAESIQQPLQGICPPNWHLPTSAEFDDLVNIFGGDSYAGPFLKFDSTNTDWDYTENEGNISRFRAIPAGLVFSSFSNIASNVNGVGTQATWWIAEQATPGQGRGLVLQSSQTVISRPQFDKPSALSVRCIED